MSGIGLLNEKPLHASLKEWYAQPGDRLEIAVDGFVIDIVRKNLLLEIQTANFVSVKKKMNNLALSHRIRLIYPLAREKWIVKLPKDASGEVTRRRSPKRGRVEELFREMVSFPQLLANPNFSLEVVMIREEEVRRYAGTRHWRKRGWIVEERLVFLPEDLETFTASDLADAIGIRRQLAQKMVYCLRKGRVIDLIGKQGRANLYGIAGA
jgi:hypothetical protein